MTRQQHVPAHKAAKLSLPVLVSILAVLLLGSGAALYALQQTSDRPLSPVKSAPSPIAQQGAAQDTTTHKAATVTSLPVQTSSTTSTPIPSTVSAANAATSVAQATPAPSSTVSTLAPTATPSSTSSSVTAPAVQSTQATPVAEHYSSSNWSGYAALSGSFHAVTGSWTIPASTAVSTNEESIDGAWIGIGGVSSGDLIQTGTANVVEPNGAVTSAAFYELLPANAIYLSTMNVSVGDHISASITELAANSWQIVIENKTNGQRFATTVSYSSSYSSAEWIEEDPSYGDGSLAPFANFGTIQFTGSQADGGSGLQMADQFNPASITIVQHRRAVAMPSSLQAGAFSVTYAQ